MKTLHQAASTDDLESLRMTLREGADVNADEDGVTPLMLAVGQSANEAVRLLIEAGADVNAVSRGSTPLVYACSQGFAETASILLGAGADVHSVDAGGWTPLMHAAFCGWETVLHLLLDYRADVYARNAQGQTALDLAAEGRQAVSAVLLREYGAPIEQTLSARGGKAEQMRWLTETSRLLFAAMHGDVETLQEFRDADPGNLRITDDMGQTLLMLAAQNGRYHAAELLLDGGLDVDAEGVSGRTALMDAVEAGYINTARLLIRRGADPGRRSNAEWSALSLAASREDLEMVRMILEESQDIPSAALDFEAALLWAGRADRPDIAALIEIGRKHAKAA